jgi:hypothetical protein
MAKHKTKKELLDTNVNMDFGLDGEDADFNVDPLTEDRNPVIRAGKGVLTGFTDAITDTDFIRDRLKEVLPKGYGQTIDFGESTLGKASEQIDQIRRELAPGLKGLRKTIARSIPPDARYVPNFIKETLKEWKNEGPYRGPDEQGQRESMLSAQMADIFKAEASDRQATRKEDQARDDFKHGADQMRHRDSMGVMGDIAASISRIDQYTRTVNLGFQKKSLELQYRQLFAMQDIVKLGHKQLELIANELPQIKKNTGLPDYVKMTDLEFLKEQNKRRLAQAAGEFMFGSTRDYMAKSFKSVAKAATTELKDLMDKSNLAIEAIGQAIETAQTTGGSLIDIVAQMGGDKAAMKLATYVVEKFGDDFFKKNKSLTRIGLKGARFASNVNENLNAWREKQNNNFEDGWFNSFQRWVANQMPGTSGSKAIEDRGVNEVGAAAIYNQRTDRSINEVIPGYLARILQQVQSWRTGTEVELTTYDTAKGVFISKTDMKKLINERAFDSGSAAAHHKNASYIFSEIEKTTGQTLSDTAKRSLQRRLTYNSLAQKKADSENLGNASNYEDKEGAAEAAAAVSAYLQKASQASLNTFEDSHRRLREVKNTYMPIQHLVDQGHGNLLREMGIVDANSNTISTKHILDTYMSMQGNTQVEPVQQKSFLSQAMGTQNSPEAVSKLMAQYDEHYKRFKGKSKDILASGAKKLGIDLTGVQTPAQLLEAALKAPAGSALTKAVKQVMESQGAAGDLARLGKEGLDSTMTAILDKKKQLEEETMSLLERCTVDGEIDFEKLYEELSKYPAKVRDKIMNFIRYLQGLGNDLVLKVKQYRANNPASAPTEVDVPQVGDTPPAPGPDGTVKQFAEGGVFNGDVLSAPKGFMMQDGKGKPQKAVAGEAGTEAIVPVSGGGAQVLDVKGDVVGHMPLARDKAGRLSLYDRWNLLKSKAKKAAEDLSQVSKDYAMSNGIDADTALMRLRQKINSGVDKLNHYKLNAAERLSSIGARGTASNAAYSDRRATHEARMEALTRDMLQRLDLIAAKDMGHVPKESLLRQNARWLGKGFLGLGKTSAKLGFGLAKKGLSLGGRASWGMAKGLFGAASGLLSNVSDWVRPKDVYVGDEKAPRVYGSGIEQGKYRKQITGTILTSHKDIDEPIIDESGNIVIRGEELDDMRYRNRNKFVKLSVKAGRLLGKGFGLFGKGVKKAFDYSLKMFGWQANILGIGLNVVKKGIMAGYDWLGREVDVYTPGVEHPVLVATLMRKGYYTSKKTGLPIYRYADIDGPVMDGDGNQAVTLDMIKAGLVDKNGKKIRTAIGRLFFGGLGMAKGAVKLIGKGVGLAARASWGLAKMVGRGIGAIGRGIGRFMKGGVPGLFGAGGAYMSDSEKTVALLADIRDILQRQQEGVDGSDGPMGPPKPGQTKNENGWRALAEKAKDKAKAYREQIGDQIKSAKDKFKKPEKAVSSESKGIMDMLGSLKDALSGAAGLLSRFGLGAGAAAAAGTLASGAAAATTVAGGTAAAAGGTAAVAGTAAAAGTAGTAGIAALGGLSLGAAMLVGGAAAVVVGGAGWLAYKGIQSYRNRLTSLDKLRLAQYGFLPDDSDNYARVIQMERMLQAKQVRSANGIEYVEKGIQMKDLMGLFDLDSENKNHLLQFTTWYRNRFKPVFLTHLNALSALGLKVDVDEICHLKKEVAAKYLQIAAFTDGPYSVVELPTTDVKYQPTGSGVVTEIVTKLKAEFGASKSSPNPKGALSTDDKPKQELPGAAQADTGADGVQMAKSVAKATAPGAMSLAAYTADGEPPPRPAGAIANKLDVDKKANPQGLRLAGGPLLEGKNGFNLIRQAGKLKMAEVNPAFLKQFFGAVEEYYQLTGKRVTVTDAYRSFEDQVEMKRKYGSKAATPGQSPHGFGLALDVDSKDLDDMDDLGLLRKYGLLRPVGGEPWHLEPAGVQLNMEAYKRNAEMASRVIEEGIGRGGGGLGSIRNSEPGSRDLALSEKIISARIGENVQTSGVKQDWSAGGPLKIGSPAIAAGAGAASVKLGVDFKDIAGSTDAEPKPNSTAQGRFESIPTAAPIAAARAAFISPSAGFEKSASPSSSLQYNRDQVSRSVQDNTAGAGVAKSVENLLGESVQHLGDIKDVLMKIYTAMTGEDLKSKSASSSPSAQQDNQVLAMTLQAIETAVTKAVTAAVQETRAAGEQNSSSAQAVPMPSQPAAKSPIFSLPTLPVPMRRSY